ncbi:MAG: anaerobic ribonucleoside-triphosphate reductase activating protein [Chromatiaceae bacterium]|nr:anaerobic ribonucleoside-triphosphate reductase activating protein [Chromatiaceae bacterium]
MRIGGLTPLTSIDYPGELAAVVFCQGCPWRCRYCQNTHLLPVRTPDPIPWPRVRAFLAQRRGLLDALVFSGGEPTLQPALRAAMSEAAAMGFKIGLHTAGPSPQRLRRLLPWLGWVGLDIKAPPGDYRSVTGVPGSGERAWESLDLLLGAGVALEVRTTLMPAWTLEAEIAPLMERLAARGVGRYVLQPARTDACLDTGLAGSPVAYSLGELRALGARLFPAFEVRAA